jgi:hypothetical protein
MHRESTQALSGEQAVQAGTMQTPVSEASVVCEALAGLRSDGGVNKGLAARRTVRHGQIVIARWSGIQRTSVHGCQGTVLKRLAVTNRMRGKQEQATKAALVDDLANKRVRNNGS